MSDIVQDLRSIQEKYKNDIVSVGRISINEMAKGCADHIEHLQSENTRLQIEVNQYKKFKDYFDSLYGQGLEVANWHLNGSLEPFDNFFDSAVDEMECEQ